MTGQRRNQRSNTHGKKEPGHHVAQGTPGRHRPDRKCELGVLAFLLALIVFVVPASDAGEAKRLFRIGTGGLTRLFIINHKLPLRSGRCLLSCTN